MASGILIFCERFGTWAVAMRRHLADDATKQRETRSLAECREALAENAASLVVLEMRSDNLQRAMEWLAGVSNDFPQVRTIVVAQRELAAWQWQALEFGCLAFTTSPRDLQGIADLVRRYFASLPQPELDLEEQVWASLPWPSHPLPLTTHPS